MFWYLLILFTVIPALELMLLFKVGSQIGALNTFCIIILTGIVGAILTKSQGKFIIFDLQNKLRSGKIPTSTIVEGVMVFAAGLMLITPGFFTDCLGFIFVFPLTRKPLAHLIQVWIAKLVKNGTIKVMKTKGFNFSSSNSYSSSDTQKEDIIDVEFERKSE